MLLPVTATIEISGVNLGDSSLYSLSGVFPPRAEICSAIRFLSVWADVILLWVRVCLGGRVRLSFGSPVIPPSLFALNSTSVLAEPSGEITSSRRLFPATLGTLTFRTPSDEPWGRG